MRQHDTTPKEPSHNDREEALKFLKENNTMVIATVSRDGVPHAATVYYMVDDKFDVYFCTGEETRKYLNIKDNAKVALAIGTGPEIRTIQGGGQAEWVIEGQNDLIIRMGKMFHLQHSQYWPIIATEHQKIALMKINVEWMTFLHVFLDGDKYIERKCQVFPK